MANIKLKPCPFCGGEAIMENLNVPTYRFRVICNNVKCDVHPNTWLRRSAKEAAEVWNRRAK